MKMLKKLLCAALVLMLIAAPATALAAGYDLGEGDVYVDASGDEQYVWYYTKAPVSSIEDYRFLDPSPVIYGVSKEFVAYIAASNGNTAVATLADLSAPGVIAQAVNGRADIRFSGTSDVGGKEEYAGLIILGNNGADDKVILGGSGTLNATGSGSGMVIYDQKAVVTGGTINASSAKGDGIYVNNGSLSVNGGTVNASGKVYGVTLNDGSTLSVTNSYLTYGSITASGKKGAFSKDDTSGIVIGENNFVLDAKGRDITADVLKDPSLLYKLEDLTIATKDTAIFPGGDMSSNIHIITAFKNTTFEKTGEPSEEAMKALSEGMTGECIFSGSYAFTDQIDDHDRFQVNIILPQYAGKHVILATLADGEVTTYERWVANNGTVWCLTRKLGDFAIFMA